MTDISQIDYRTIAQSRITQQYGDKPKFVELVRELAGLVEDDLETPAANLFDILDIDLMEGANLDNIGNIVGQSRVLIDYDLLEFFGYDGATAAGTYGDLNDSAVGERYLSYFEESGGTKELSDPEYRLFIKARIIKNYSDGTRDDIVESIKVLFDAEQVKIDEGVMTLDIGILGNLSDNDLALVQEYDILPRPTGVGITSVYNYGLLEFNGASTQIDFASTTDFDIGSGDFEIRTKIKTDQPNQAILSKEDDVNHTTASYSAYVKNGTARFGYSPSDGTFIEYDSGIDVIDNNIRAIVVSRAGTVLTIAVDDESYIDAMTSDPFTGTADFLKIGNTQFPDYPDTITVSGTGTSLDGTLPFVTMQDGRPQYAGGGNDVSPITFDGWLANDVGIELWYNPLTDYLPPKVWPDISDPSGYPAPAIDYVTPEHFFGGLIFDTSITISGTQEGKWLINEGTGTTATDDSGNGNDGTITDGTWVTTLS